MFNIQVHQSEIFNICIPIVLNIIKVLPLIQTSSCISNPFRLKIF